MLREHVKLYKNFHITVFNSLTLYIFIPLKTSFMILSVHYISGARSKHEGICEFIPVLCPNKNCLAGCRKSELEDHLKVCVKTPCSHEVKGIQVNQHINHSL